MYKINTIPYFLWNTKELQDAALNNDKKSIDFNERSSSISIVPKYVIFLLKHLPFIALLVVYGIGFYVDVATVIIPLILMAIIGLVFYLDLHTVIKKMIAVLFVLGSWYLIYLGYAVHFDLIIGNTIKLTLAGLIIFDIYKLWKYEDYYYLNDEVKHLSITGNRSFPLRKSKASRVKFLDWNIGGFFLKVIKDKK